MNIAPKKNWLAALSVKAQLMLARIAAKHGVGPAAQLAEELLHAKLAPARRRRIGWSAKSDRANLRQRRVRLAMSEGPGTLKYYDMLVTHLINEGHARPHKQAQLECRAVS